MSNELKHTKGDWKIYGTHIYAYGPVNGDGKGRPIAAVNNHSNCWEPENLANAMLIAAAPDLLAALEKYEMAEYDPQASERKGYFEVAKQMRVAALTKAKGM